MNTFLAHLQIPYFLSRTDIKHYNDIDSHFSFQVLPI